MSIGIRGAVMLIIVMVAGCGEAPNAPQSDGEQFVGAWVGVKDPRALMHIEKHQNAFVLRFEASARGRGLGREDATGLYKDGVLEVRRAGIAFTFVLNEATGELATGFPQGAFRRRREGEVPPPPPAPIKPKL